MRPTCRPRRTARYHPLRLALLAASLLAVVVGCQRAPTPAPQPSQAAGADARRIEADVRFLADDLLEGRETATRGHELAARYVAQRMRAIGLTPAGDAGSYFQRVPLLRATRIAEGATLAIRRDGATTALRFGAQFLPALNYNQVDASVTAPLVFVGQAVHAPERSHDDFAGLDLRGKIAVLFHGAPPGFDPDLRAFHSAGNEKLRALVARGAIGAIFVNTPDSEQRAPWAHTAADWAKPGMRLRREASPLGGRRAASPLGGRDAGGRGIDTFPQLRVTATVRADAAPALLGARTAALFQAALDGKLRGFDLPGTVTLRARSRVERVESRNVVGRLPGSEATLARQQVALTAHLDHVGIGAPVAGDVIYNGALDNALGVAVMLEAAQQLALAPLPPKRSLLFVALTGEEQGLLGADWFVRAPPASAHDVVANVNMDMPVLLAPSRDVVPVGLAHSSLQPLVEAAAEDVGVALSPDPAPEQTVFVRSDQYAFVRRGIPAVYLAGGVRGANSGDDPATAARAFMQRHYHRPSDDAHQPIHYPDAARLARLNAAIARAIGDAAARPRWNAGDFFGERFARPPAAVGAPAAETTAATPP